MKKTEILTNPRLYAAFWFENYEKRQKLKSAPGTMTYDFSGMWLDYLEDFRGLNSRKYKRIIESDLQKAFSEQARLIPLKKFKLLEESLVCHKENLSLLQKWVMSITNQIKQEDVAIIAHWIWMVKNKLRSTPVIWHIMPVVVGGQGSGKSTAIINLLKPVRDFQFNMKMDKLGDENLFPSLATNLVVFFDELEGIQRTDLNTLKNQVTTDANSYRPLYKQDRITVPMRCSFIGATNKALDESFYDATGMRRFYALQASKTIDWETINNLDYDELWKGIDENKDKGYLQGEALKIVQSIQASYVNPDDIDDYIAEHQILPVGNEHKTIPSKELYQHYRIWAHQNGVKFPLSQIMFHKRLCNRDVQWNEKRDDTGIRVRYYKVSANCSILANAPINRTVLEFKT